MSYNVELKEYSLEIEESEMQRTFENVKRSLRPIAHTQDIFKEVELSQSLEEAMLILDYEVEIHEEGSLRFFVITKLSCGYGEEERFIRALLEDSVPNSYFLFRDEDDAYWKYKKLEDRTVDEVSLSLKENMSSYAFELLLEEYKAAIKTRDSEEIHRIERILESKLT